MLIPAFKFELKYHFSQAVFKIAMLIFFLLGVIAVQGGFGADVYKNSPYTIVSITGLLSLCAIFSTTLLCANAVLRDKTYRLESILFSTSIKKGAYFFTRFTGLFIAVFLTVIVTSVGMIAGGFLLPSSDLGPFNEFAYLYALLTIGFPNVLLCCSVIFCAAMLTRNVRVVYAAGVLLYVLYWAGSILGNSPLLANSDPTATPGNASLLADPFALSIFFKETKQWTIQQKNNMLLPLEGIFLMNRVIWITIASLILGITFRVFKFRLKLSSSTGKSAADTMVAQAVFYKKMAVFTSGFIYSWKSFLSQLKLETIALFRNIPFMVMMILWIFMYTVELKDTLFGGIYSIRSYPDTSRILEEFAVIRPAMMLIIFYAAELIWRERSVNIHPLVYSTPVRNISAFMAKLACLAILIVFIVTANIGIGVGLQLAAGYNNIQLVDYASLYYYSGVPLLLFAVLAMFIITISPNKYIGMLVAVIILAIIIFSRRIGIEHYLFRFATTPEMFNSSMNGFGHYASAFNWYMLYWLGFGMVLAVFSILLWQTGREQGLLQRVRLSATQMGRMSKIVTVIGCMIWVAAGFRIYYQTNVIGKYKNKVAAMKWQVAYEKKFKPMVMAEQPVIRSVKTNVDIYPRQQRYTVKGVYKVMNESTHSVNKIWLGVDPEVTTAEISVPSVKHLQYDKEFGQYQYELARPLMPGQQMEITFSVNVDRSGFTDFNNEHSVVSNGSYIELEKYLPYFGYNDRYENGDRDFRIMNGLRADPLILPADTLYHYVDYETTVSTDPDQQAVTVGELKSSWKKDGRAFFHYKTEEPIRFMFAVSSAKYRTRKEVYKNVELKLYYHPGHEANLDAIMDGMKDALDYGNEQFAPYASGHLTLAEIPQYRGAATAYPGVLFSAERINFLSDYRDSSRVNQAYAITTHETAHQWWAMKLEPAANPGNKVLTESLAKYTENMVIRKRSGTMYLRNYLREDNQLYMLYHSETEDEQAMDTVLGQPFVYYQKGGLSLYAIQESMGEQRFNSALRKLLGKYSKHGTKAGVKDLYRELLAEADPAQAMMIEDVFKRIITWNISLDSIVARPLPDGRYEISVKIDIQKFDGVARSAKKIAVNDSVQIAAFDLPPEQWSSKTKPLYIGKHFFNTDRSELRFIVNKKPVAVSIDPYALLLGSDQKSKTKIVKDNFQR